MPKVPVGADPVPVDDPLPTTVEDEVPLGPASVVPPLGPPEETHPSSMADVSAAMNTHRIHRA